MGKRDVNLANDSDALRLVVEGTVSETGTEFFRALVKNLATVMNTTGAWVTEYIPGSRSLRAHAFWLNGDFLQNYEQRIDGTPCEDVVTGKRFIHIPDRVLEIYPVDRELRIIDAVSYMGVPLLDTDGAVMGHLAVLDTKPLPPEPRSISMFEIFAARAAAEQRRLKRENEIRAREEELSALLGSAMDAIVVLDESNAILRINPAAQRLFGCTAEDLLAENFRDFLPAESAARFNAFLAELDNHPEGSGQLWIPQSFIVQRWDKSTFPAEATISRFTNRGQVFRTVILRNIDERLAAERRIELLNAEAEFLRETANDFTSLGGMLGNSAAMKEVFDSIKRVAATDATVLIFGETGTGKELVARSIHEASARKDKLLIRVNCAAIPGTLMESEFFGHERGAFTGAMTKREGRFALADEGTIFLDEVGELPLDLQAKLLRVLQEGEFEPLGSARTRKVNVRAIAATNRDLLTMVGEGKFREDLYYRLNVFPMRVPSLRERGNDITLLAKAFVERFARRMGRRINPLHPDDIRRIQNYSWPGNVRELQNVIERAIILTTGSRVEMHRALPLESTTTALSGDVQRGPVPDVMTAVELESLERVNLERALAVCGGKISGEGGVAQRLGLPASTVTSRMKALGLQRKG